MPGIGDRIEGWVEGLSAKWKDRLAGWGLGVLSRGINKAAEDMEPGALDGVRSMLLKLRDNPNLPADMKATIDKVITPGNPILVVLGVLVLLMMMTGTIGALFAPINRATEYKVDRLIESFRMDPMSIITAWRRDPEKYAWLLDDLDEQGWSDAKKEALKFLTQVIPSAGDIVRFAVREAYSPEIARKFGQYEDFPEEAMPDASKAGITRDLLEKQWAAHWDLPSPMQGFEMLHRGIIDEATLKLLLRALDVMPFWRDKLVEMSWNIPTRVDIRRFFDMGVIDEGRLRELYTAYGYHGTDLDNYVEWTIKQTKTVKTTAEKELTKAEIIKGVKKELLSWDEGVELIMDLDYDAATADLILAINLAAAAGSPETVEEFRDLTQKYRKAMGMTAKPVTEELKKAAAEVVRLAREVKSLSEAVEAEKKMLVGEEPLPEAATAKLKGLQVSQHRAEAELARAKGEYDKLLAQWRHGAG